MAVTLTDHVTATGLSTSMPLNRIGAADAANLGKWQMVWGVIAGTPTPATGWTLIISKLLGGSRQMRIFIKQHEGTAEPASYTFTSGTSSRYILHGAILEGAHTDTPPDVAVGWDSSNVAQTNAEAQSIDPTVSDALSVILACAVGVTTYTPPAGYTELSDFAAASQISSMLCFKQLSSGDPTPVETVTLAAAFVCGTMHMAIKPAAAGGTTHPLAADVVGGSTVTVGTLAVGHALAASAVGGATLTADLTAPGTPQFLRAVADIAIGNWTDHLGGTTNLWQVISETVADDGDYIESGNDPAGDTIEFLLGPGAEPVFFTDHFNRLRFAKSGPGQINLVVSLREGAATEIASWTFLDIGSTPTLDVKELAEAAAQAVVDHTDLRLRIVATLV